MIYKIRWVWDRWKIMDHPWEEIYRMKQQIQYHIIDRRWYIQAPLKNDFRYDTDLSGMSEYSLEGLQKVVRETAGDIRKFKLLNVVIDDIIANNKWNYDFKNRIQGQRRFVHEINDFNYELGEIKYVYELSRLYHVPMVAAYALAVSDNRLLKRVEEQLRDWFRQNPFLGTTAWKSGNVVGIRALNLVLYRNLLSLSDEDHTEIDRFLNPLMELHYRFLLGHLSLYSSKGNHHIGELAGLIALCSVYRFEGMPEQFRCFLSELESETLRLIHKDGFNKEQATRYQASYINLIVASFRLARYRGFELSAAVKERIERMYAFLDVFRISHATFFNVGDDDNAELIYPYFDSRYNVYESMLNDASMMFDKPICLEAHFDLRNYLLWGDKGLDKFSRFRQDLREDELCRLYPDSGYFVIKDNRVRLLFDLGRIGLLPTMGHGHSDILNVLLYIDGKPVLVDCGSFQYNVHYKKFRDYFHGVHSHNTISIDGKEQALPSSGMFWMSNPKVSIDCCETVGYNSKCSAWHDGYEREEMRVRHWREVNYRKDEERIVLKDEIRSEKPHEASFYLHFHPETNVVLENGELIIDGGIRIINPLFNKGRLIKGDMETPLGWYSRCYDSIEPTCSFVVKFTVDGQTEIKTEIKF